MVHKLQGPCEDHWPGMVGQTYSGPGRNPGPLSYTWGISLFPPPAAVLLAFGQDEFYPPSILRLQSHFLNYPDLPVAPGTTFYDRSIQGILRNVQVDIDLTPGAGDLFLCRFEDHGNS